MKKRTRSVRHRAAGGRPASKPASRTDDAHGGDGLLGLQSRAGNAAVTSLVQRSAEENGATVTTTQKESSDVYERATAAFESGRFDEADRLFSSLLAGRYRHRESLTAIVWSLAICKAHAGDFDGAYELAITYGHYGGGRADELRLLEQVERVRQTAGGDAPGAAVPRTEDDARSLYEQASAAFEGGQYEAAVSMFETLLASPVKHDEAMPTVVWNLAMSKAHLGDFDRAYDLALQYGRFRASRDERELLERIEGLRQAAAGADVSIPKTADEASALYQQASESFEKGDWQQAAGMFETLLAAPAKHIEARPTIVWNLAMCRAHLGDFDGARRLALTYTQYRGTEDDERQLFARIEGLQQHSEASSETAVHTGT